MILLFFLGYLSQIAASLSVVPSLQHIPPGVRAACRVTLAKNVTQCSEAFHKQLKYIHSSTLPEICTEDCANGLSSLYSEALSRCGTDTVDITVNDTVIAIFRPLDLVGELNYKYNTTCLQGDGGFCKDKLEDVTDDELCSDCYLKSVQLDINQPIPDTPSNPDDFNSLKAFCDIPTTSYPVDLLPTGSPPPPTQTCASPYTVKEGDTVNSVAKSLSVSTDRLLAYNGLPLNLDKPITKGDKLCLDEVSKCLIHQAVAEDTCSSLVKLAGSAVDKLMLWSWNPTIGTDCANLKFMIGKYICIGPPGQTGEFTPVVPSTTTPPAITTPPDTFTWGPASDTFTNSINFTTSWPFPTYDSLVPTNTPTLPSAEDVSAMLERLKFCPFKDELNSTIWDEGLEDEEYHIHSWDLEFDCMDEYWDPHCFPEPDDPILPSPTDIPSSCQPTITKIIPHGWVEPPGPTESGAPNNCNKWHLVKSGDSCSGIAAKYKITVAELHRYNPSINSRCSDLRESFAICVRVWDAPPVTTTTSVPGPPGPTASGTSPTCKRWHILAEDDTCESIAAEYGIVVGRFRQLNRSVNSSCTNLVVGSAYCVG